MGARGSFWTTENLINMLTSWDAGRSAAEIADELGCTRNTVIGRLKRLGLLGRLSKQEISRRMSDGTARSWALKKRKKKRPMSKETRAKMSESVRRGHARRKAALNIHERQKP